MRPSWDSTWMQVAVAMSKRSPCVRAQVGAVIVSSTNRVIATGYNGPPAGVGVTAGEDCKAFCHRPNAESLDPAYGDCISIHAEANALLFCDRRDREGGTIYITSAVCWSCAKLVANSGLERVVVKQITDSVMHRNPQVSIDMMIMCGLTVVQV